MNGNRFAPARGGRAGAPRGALPGAGLVAAIAIALALAASGERRPAAVGLDTASPAVRPAHTLPPLGLYVGRSFFEDPWIVAPASTTLRDGLGPLYNAHACASCHRPAARVRADEGGEPPTRMVLRIGRRVGGAFVPDPVYGDTIQRRGIPGLAAGATGEARWGIAHVEEEVGDGPGVMRLLRRPVPRIESFAYGDPAPGLLASLRAAPALEGAGRIERVAEAALLALEDPGDADGDGISGRAHRLPAPDGPGWRIGRYGHKATQPSLALQVAAALRDDLGITSRHFPDESCTPVQADCAAAPGGAGPDGPFEIPDAILDALVAHVASLAPPIDAGTPGVAGRADRDEGARAFRATGCAACHVPALPGVHGERVVLHSDLLLHDMGEGLADELGEGDASGAEWRTAPLVGVAVRERGGLLHDGRARDLVEAILWHGGEAAVARERFRGLDEAGRAALLAYLRAL